VGRGPVLVGGTGPVSIEDAVEIGGGAACEEGLGRRGFGWVVGGKLGGPRLGMGAFISLVSVGGPRGAGTDVGGGWEVGRDEMGG